MAKNPAVNAAVTIDPGAFADPRFELLAKLCGLADHDHARAKMERLWSVCTARHTHVAPPVMIVACLGRDGGAAIVEADLGELLENGDIRLRGSERFDWFREHQEKGVAGGRNRVANADRDERGRLLSSKRGDAAPTSARPASPSTARPLDASEPARSRPRSDQDQNQPQAGSDQGESANAAAPAGLAAAGPPRAEAAQPIADLARSVDEILESADNEFTREMRKKREADEAKRSAYASSPPSSPLAEVNEREAERQRAAHRLFASRLPPLAADAAIAESDADGDAA